MLSIYAISGTIPENDEIELAIKERLLAKKEKNFSKADQIRETLRSKGIDLIDKSNGKTEWLRK